MQKKDGSGGQGLEAELQSTYGVEKAKTAD